jgi:hypothetical protein
MSKTLFFDATSSVPRMKWSRPNPGERSAVHAGLNVVKSSALPGGIAEVPPVGAIARARAVSGAARR